MEALLMTVDLVLSVTQVALLVYVANMLRRLVASETPEVEETMIDPNRYYSIREVKDAFGVHESTVRRWIYGGSLPAHRVGFSGLYRVSGVDLLAFLGSRSAGVK